MRAHRNYERIQELLRDGRDYTNNQASEADGWIKTWFAFADVTRNTNWKNAADSYRFGNILSDLGDTPLNSFRENIEELRRDSLINGDKCWGVGGHDSVKSNEVHQHCATIFRRILETL